MNIPHKMATRKLAFAWSILSLSGSCLFAESVSVEAVLRALQDRQVVLEVKRAIKEDTITALTPIQWGENIGAYPQDGTITDLGDALKALNIASRTFDHIKRDFLCYDKERSRF